NKFCGDGLIGLRYAVLATILYVQSLETGRCIPAGLGWLFMNATHLTPMGVRFRYGIDLRVR
ncbi:hypothetical protein, partial [Pseudomonas sp. FSL R10-1339]|uniref:hypothetical protein n=1 Tax=Pseudomonas sp. FSL R10-1339 TaxID=2662196 RepID=UPI001C49ACFA